MEEKEKIIHEANLTRLSVLYHWDNFEKTKKLATHDFLNRALAKINYNLLAHYEDISPKNLKRLLYTFPLIREFVSTTVTTNTTITISKTPHTTVTPTFAESE